MKDVQNIDISFFDLKKLYVKFDVKWMLIMDGNKKLNWSWQNQGYG